MSKRRVVLKGIENGASIDQMYVARSQCRRPPSGIRRVKSSSSSNSLISSLIKAWLHDPEIKRKKRVAKYKVYTFEGDARSERGKANMLTSQKSMPNSRREVAFGTSSSSSSRIHAPQLLYRSSSTLSPLQTPNPQSTSLQTCKEPPNAGKTYFGCPMQKSETYKFCKCEDDQSEDRGKKKADSSSSSRGIDDEDKKEIRELVEEVRRLQNIVEKLSKLSMKLFVDAKMEKFTLKGLLPTWFFIAVGLVVLATNVYGNGMMINYC